MTDPAILFCSSLGCWVSKRASAAPACSSLPFLEKVTGSREALLFAKVERRRRGR